MNTEYKQIMSMIDTADGIYKFYSEIETKHEVHERIFNYVCGINDTFRLNREAFVNGKDFVKEWYIIVKALSVLENKYNLLPF